MNKNCIKNIIFAGHINNSSAEVRKQILISSAFSLVSIVLLLIFGFESLSADKNVLATVVLGSAGMSAANYFFLYRTGNYKLSAILILILIVALCSYLLCSGGSENTGPLWFFILPVLNFYILGLRRGCLSIVAIFGLCLYVLYVPDNFLLHTSYPPKFIHRFTGALFSITVIVIAYEYTREDARKELLALSKKYDMLSREDELTGLSNRRDILEKLQNEVNRFERSNNSFSVLIADIDHFKEVNDNYGHEFGDNTLKQIASTLAGNTQKRDTVARWGGEEFLILLPETSLRQAEKTASRLIQAVNSLAISNHNTAISTTVSIGVAEYQQDQTINELINSADTFLYQAKNEGRNRAQSSSQCFLGSTTPSV